MQITTELHDDEILLKLSGDVDGLGADELAVQLAKAEDCPASRIVLDFGGVLMITSSGLGTIIITFKRLESTGRSLELINLKPNVRKVFLMTGLDKILKMQESAGDELRAKDDVGRRAMRNAREFFVELLGTLGVEEKKAEEISGEVFEICDRPLPTDSQANQLREILAGLELPRKIAESRKLLANDMHERIVPYIVGMSSLLHVRCGDGRLAELFTGDFDKIQLMDIEDRNETQLDFAAFDGVNIPLPDKAFDLSLLNCVLSHCQQPEAIMAELLRVTRKRIVVIENICLNEAQRQFNIFFDWLFNYVLLRSGKLAYKFRKPEDWKWFFRDHGLSIRASVDMGLDQPAVPEYHWMYVLDLPGR